MNRRMLAVGVIILLLFGVNVSGGFVKETKDISSVGVKGNILYVGGSGAGNYTTIQSAVNDASDGDIVFVYDDSSPYNGSISIAKSFNLIGEDRNSTIIEDDSVIISISSSDVVVSGFSLILTDNFGINILTNGHNICISNNIIDFGETGISTWDADSIEITGNIFNCISISIGAISIWDGSNHLISHNIINSKDNTEQGEIWINGGQNNIISNNTITGLISNCWTGIEIYGRNHVVENNKISGYDLGISSYGLSKIIKNNYIYNCFTGLYLREYMNSKILNNNFINCSEGVSLFFSNFNNILNNNFIDNSRWNAGFSVLSLYNTWDGNYWSKSRDYPKIIVGSVGFIIPSWINIDWHPASEPYDIEV